MSRLGETLRAQRERKGITLDQAATDTRIREKFLAALEQGDVATLPGAAPTKGFLRNYASYLELDVEEVVVLFHTEKGMVSEPSTRRQWDQRREADAAAKRQADAIRLAEASAAKQRREAESAMTKQQRDAQALAEKQQREAQAAMEKQQREAQLAMSKQQQEAQAAAEKQQKAAQAAMEKQQRALASQQQRGPDKKAQEAARRMQREREAVAKAAAKAEAERQRREAKAATKQYKAMKPIEQRNFVFTPKVLVPALVVVVVLGFGGYLGYQFSSFAFGPKLDVSAPSSDSIAQESAYVVKGTTIPEGRVTVQVFPGPFTVADVKPASDGTFSVPVTLTSGSNHIVVEVLDPAGKVSKVSRNVIFGTTVGAPIKLVLDSPANGARVENAAVVVSGTTDAASLTINGTVAPITGPGGRFEGRFSVPAGPQVFTVVAKNAAGGSVTETRNVTVAYTAAVVVVNVRGGDSWIQVTVDGTIAAGTGRVFKDGETVSFAGREVVVRAGNAAATQITYNGQFAGALGAQGQVVERVYSAPR